jgi:hypothetical protein
MCRPGYAATTHDGQLGLTLCDGSFLPQSLVAEDILITMKRTITLLEQRLSNEMHANQPWAAQVGTEGRRNRKPTDARRKPKERQANAFLKQPSQDPRGAHRREDLRRLSSESNINEPRTLRAPWQGATRSDRHSNP